MTTAPKSTLHIIADTRDGQAVADSLTREMRLRGFAVVGEGGDVVIAVIAPGANPRTLFSGIDRQQTPIIVVAVGSLAPNFPGSEYSAVTPIRHDTGVPGRTPNLLIAALDELAEGKIPAPSAATPPKPAASQSPSLTDKVEIKNFPPQPSSGNRITTFINSPLGSQIIGGLILAGILAIFGLIGSQLSQETITPTATNTPLSTLTIEPTLTETIAPTSSPVPPTNTAALPTHTSEPPTLTPLPPTFTPVPVTDGSPLQIFISSDTLTIYLADSSAIDGLRFVDIDGESYPLGAYSSWAGIQFASMTTPPLCIVLRHSGASSPLPTVCATIPANNRFIHPLIAANLFWYDGISTTLAFQVFIGDRQLGVCPPAASECTLTLPDQ